MSGLRILVLAYRDWALPVVESIRRHPSVERVDHARTDDEYSLAMTKTLERPDLVLLCGWSGESNAKWIEEVEHVGVHCAELDTYSGGTPLQNQIIDGVRRTKHRIFKVGHPELSLRLWSHEVDLDLSGDMTDVLEQMTITSKALFNFFLDDWPHVQWKKWPSVPSSAMRPGRTPKMSALSKERLSQMTTREMYDFFRCLTEPYPNGYIEDEYGRLYVEKVRFKEK